MSSDLFREIAGEYSEDGFFGYTGYADLIMAASDAGVRVVAFDTRSPQSLSIDPSFDVAPVDMVQFPQDLLGPIQAAYEQRGGASFDQISAEAVRNIAGDSRASVWIGNGHIHGGHEHGDPQGDFDTYLGVEDTARITMFADAPHYEEYMTGGLYNIPELECAAIDQPDFMTFAEEAMGLATTSALSRNFNTTNLTIVDVPAPCYSPETPAVISQPGVGSSGAN